MPSLHDLLQTIKRAALEAVETGEPTAVFIGTVEEKAPLQVRLNQRLVLSERRLVRLNGQDQPEEGDKLALLRFAGGQNYLVLGCLQ